MSKHPPLLEGEVVEPDPDESEIARLRDELRRVQGERDTLRAENIRLRQRVNQVDAPAAHLRQTLEPLYQAMQALFGDLEVIDPPSATTTQPGPATAAKPTDDRTSAVWESWKAKLGSAPGKIIDALMKHGEANTQQLSILTGLHRTTIPKGIYELNKAGLISKNGGRFSLKQI